MHYRNGREAKVGDRVVGQTYNTKGQIAGTLVSLTPGQDVCSAKVGLLDAFPTAEMQRTDCREPGFIGQNDRIAAIQGSENHGANGAPYVTLYREDYTEAGLLWHADDAWYVNADGAAVQPPPKG